MHQYVLLTLRIRLLRCYWHRDCLLRPWLLPRVQSISRTWLVFDCRKPRAWGPCRSAPCAKPFEWREVSVSRGLHCVRRDGTWPAASDEVAYGASCSVRGTRYAVLSSELRDR